MVLSEKQAHSMGYRVYAANGIDFATTLLSTTLCRKHDSLGVACIYKLIAHM